MLQVRGSRRRDPENLKRKATKEKLLHLARCDSYLRQHEESCISGAGHFQKNGDKPVEVFKPVEESTSNSSGPQTPTEEDEEYFCEAEKFLEHRRRAVIGDSGDRRVPSEDYVYRRRSGARNESRLTTPQQKLGIQRSWLTSVKRMAAQKIVSPSTSMRFHQTSFKFLKVFAFETV